METLTKTGNIIIDSIHNNKKIVLDARYIANGRPKSVVVFIHGFKGFKDWGHFNLIADFFAQKGYFFIKLNLSHNGTTPDAPTEFRDLEAFGNNNYCIELDDVGTLIDYLFNAPKDLPSQEMDLNSFFLIGHSRGGALAILKAREDSRVKAIATWAAVSNLSKRWTEDFVEEWEKNGVQYVYNARTKQNMPMYYQLWDNFQNNKARLDIPEAVWQLEKPVFVIHGFEDETLPVSMGFDISEWNPDVEVLFLENANHTFGGYHPYDKKVLPEHSQLIVEKTHEFFEKALKAERSMDISSC